MYGEFSLYGVFVPKFLVVLTVAYALKTLVRFLLARTPFYQWIWHPELFNFAMYIVLLGGMLALMHGWKS
ncbi:DUF1656 domain-containing protein [Luteibacter sp. Sphag1AF]|uniref:DUF1656 domain-containing protein n=1 Tax=Luteibacter sp. Sphag1AF TaxID=2587031 RepID=UPI00161EA30F